jgi:hypothetical protein
MYYELTSVVACYKFVAYSKERRIRRMNKTLLYLCITVFGFVGGYLPVVFGASGFSAWSVIFSTAGSIIGILVAKRLSE